MSGKIRNPSGRCKVCGAKCYRRYRYCRVCAREMRNQRREDANGKG